MYVIGPAGVGKSTFINYVIVGEPIPEESRASTTAIAVHRTNLGTPPQSFAFVDTPGFDNATNLGNILWFIKQAQRRGFQLDRTLYLHPVLEDPKSPSPEEKLHLTASRYRIQLPEATFVEIAWSLKREIIGPRGVRDHLRGKGCDTVQFGNSMASAHRIVLCLEESPNPTPPESPVGPLSELSDSTKYPQIPPIHPVGESQGVSTTTVHKLDADSTPDLIPKFVNVQKVGTASVEDIPPTDKVVLIMGPTRSGKSTFINYASGGDGKGIGHQLQSCTDTIAFTSVRYKSRKLGVANTNKPGKGTDRLEGVDVAHDNATPGSQTDSNRPEDMAISEFNRPNHGRHENVQSNEYGDDIGAERPKDQVFGAGGGPTFSGSKHLGNKKHDAPNAAQNTTTAESSVYARQTSTRPGSPADALENPQSIRDDRAQSNNPSANNIHTAIPALPGPLNYDRDQGTGPNTSLSSVSTIDSLKPSDHNDCRSAPMGQPNHENSNAHGVNASCDGVTSNADESTIAGLDDSMEEQTIWFVETPGFDDTYTSDIEILTMIAEFLIKVRHNNLKLDTILYFHRITDREMKGSVLKNLRMFASICGNVAMPNVVVVMTMWSLLPRREIGELRRKELEADFWNSMLNEGCRVAGFGDSYESAHRIISGEKEIPFSYPRKGQEGILLSIQLVDQHKKLKETEAGITLRQQSMQLIKDKKEAKKRLKEFSKRQNNPALKVNLEAESERIENSIEVSKKLRTLGHSFPTMYRKVFSGKSQEPEIPSW
ncbi:hypothetical protein FRC16_007994 [Serendipita sp. 398]|nr:hypothetical protein FRC16_007994 [Serendipita sp. 398]